MTESTPTSGTSAAKPLSVNRASLLKPFVPRWGFLLCLSISASPSQAALLLNDVLSRMETAQTNLKDVSFDFVQSARQGKLPEQHNSVESAQKGPAIFGSIRISRKSSG